MPTVKIPISELSETASVFFTYSKEISQAIANIEKRMASLQSNWEDASRQPFFQSYKVWDKDAHGVAESLSLLAREMEAIAKRYEDINT